MKVSRVIVAVVSVLVGASCVFAAGKPSDSSSSSSSTKVVHVNGYYRKDGTYVAPYDRTAPNGTKNDNWSTKGNVNPETGKAGTKPGDAGSPGTVSHSPGASSDSVQATPTTETGPNNSSAKKSSAINPATVNLSLVTLGMTKAHVVAVVGEPNVKADASWFYMNRGWVRFKGDIVTSVEAKQ